MSPCKITSPPNTHPTWMIPFRFHRKTQPKPLSVLTLEVNPNTAPLSSPCYHTLPHERTAPPFVVTFLRRRRKKMAAPNETKISVKVHSGSIETKINTMASLTPSSSSWVIQRGQIFAPLVDSCCWQRSGKWWAEAKYKKAVCPRL